MSKKRGSGFYAPLIYLVVGIIVLFVFFSMSKVNDDNCRNEQNHSFDFSIILDESNFIENKVIYRDLFDNEFDTIRNAAIRNNCTGDLFLILLAIRKAENGAEGLEFGVMHPKAYKTNLDIQAGWAAATVVKNYERWQNTNQKLDFISFLGNRYCPVGAENDPRGLNKNWKNNVRYWYRRLKDLEN